MCKLKYLRTSQPLTKLPETLTVNAHPIPDSDQHMSSSIEAAEESGNFLSLLIIISCNASKLETCEEAVSALYRVLSAAPELNFGTNASNMAATLSLCLGNHVKVPEMVEVVFGCMRVCASKSTDMQTLLCTEDIIELLIQAMCTHVNGEETVQEQGCLVVRELAKDSDDNVHLMRSLHVERVLDLAVNLIKNERNKQYPAQAKAALGL